MKEKRILVGWVALQSPFPSAFGGRKKHEVTKRNNKTKQKLKGKDAPCLKP
jgi:hypothetical protein